MSITYQTGNLFANLPTSCERYYIPHIVNNVGVIGGGFTEPLIKKWPIVAAIYREDYKHDYLILGSNRLINVGDNLNICVVNMCAQENRIPVVKKPIRYAALVKCMTDLTLFIKEGQQIIAPAFGSGLAMGNWAFIEELIEEIWGHIPVTIFKN